MGTRGERAAACPPRPGLGLVRLDPCDIHLNAVQAGARGHEQRLVVIAAEGEIGRLLRKRDGAEVAAQRVADVLGKDVVIKPSSQGSALGVVFGKDVVDLAPAIEQAFAFDDRVLIEQRIEGKEITVAVLERDGDPEALPVVEITTPAGSWYDYEHRYTPGLADHIMPAPLPEEQYRRTQEVAVVAFESLGCRDLSRADFVVPEQGEPIVLEVNTMPGMTPTSLFPDAAREAGISFEELVALLVERAVSRNS